MSAFDKNKIFFALIHYILSEQHNVDWILKTSLVNFTGLNTTINNKKFKQNSVTDDIIEYIYQIKPYHVQFEQFIEKYSSKQDEVAVFPTEQNDVTFEIRFDAVTSEVDDMNGMSPLEYMNTHMANRLWYFKRNIFDEDDMKKYINDVLNCHFKGITVDGANFDIDKSGYDAFLYDEKLYDAPTLSNEYCLVDFTENLRYKYVKNFVKVGLETLQIPSETTVLTSNCQVTSDYNGEQTQITDFKVENNLLSLYRPIRQYEKISVVNTERNTRTGYIFVGHPFMESENFDDSNMRKFVSLDTNSFLIPDGNLGSKKVTVYIIKPNGSKKVALNYEKLGDNIVVYDELGENYCVQLVVIDYRRVYDKIYTWEDAYGQSNNVITLDGDKFLRPYYEAERPSELTAVYPINNLMIYTQSGKNFKALYNANWRNDQEKMPLTPSMSTKLAKDINLGDTTIEVNDITKLFKPYKTTTDEIIPGKILVNSEIIEFHDYVEVGKKGILRGIRRASNSSVLQEVHHKNDIVYAYNEQAATDCSPKSVYISTLFKNGMENKFTIPSAYIDDSKVVVYRKPNIKLLTDIKYGSEYFDIDSNNVKLPAENINVIDDDGNIIGKVKVNKVACDIHNVVIGFTNEGIAYHNIKDNEGDYIVFGTVLEDGTIVDDNEEVIGRESSNENIVCDNDNEIIGYVNEENIVYNMRNDVIGRALKEDMGYMYINDDKVYFKSIEVTSNATYRVRGFSIDKEYSKDNALIYSFTPQQLLKKEYKIVVNQAMDERVYNDEGDVPYEIKYKDAYVILNDEPKPYEVITIGNEQ